MNHRKEVMLNKVNLTAQLFKTKCEKFQVSRVINGNLAVAIFRIYGNVNKENGFSYTNKFKLTHFKYN